MRETVQKYPQPYSIYELTIHLKATFTALFILLSVWTNVHAQGTLQISEVAIHQSGSANVVSIYGTASLRGAQTWQDTEGFHVLVPKATTSRSLNPDSRTRVKTSYGSTEILFWPGQGASVSIQATDRRLNLMVEGKLNTGPTTETVVTGKQSQAPDRTAPVSGPTQSAHGDQSDGTSTIPLSIVAVLSVSGLAVILIVRIRKRQTLPSNTSESLDSPDDGKTTRPAQASRASNAARVVMPTSIYGAYRVDQEVAKLVLGYPHGSDVLASRAPDDRKFIEASLVKAITAANASEAERNRAREALQHYGFVARVCATLLLGTDPFDRIEAARTLGAVGIPHTLHFLIEALHDPEAIVRNQSIASIGALKQPEAITSLLDVARRYSDIPASVLNKALTACSFEGEARQKGEDESVDSVGDEADFEFDKFETASIAELPETVDDPEFVDALQSLQDANVEVRIRAVEALGGFAVQESVVALLNATLDPEWTVRSVVIGALLAINHESVFSSVLIGLADESREVRASAARAMTRLSINRAEAYSRIIQTADTKLLKMVAEACLESGMFSQTISRLGKATRNQVYETFTLVCLVAKAGMLDVIVREILEQPSIRVRVGVVRLLAGSHEPGVLAALSHLLADYDLPEALQQSVSAVISGLKQTGEEDSADELQDVEVIDLGSFSIPSTPSTHGSSHIDKHQI